MTHSEIRESKNKQFLRRFIVLVVFFLLPFMLGVFTHWCICKLSNDEVQKVELSGSSTIYVIHQTETKEDEISVEEYEIEGDFNTHYTYTEEELDLLSRLIYSEGGTESYNTKLKIGSVVMNRVSDHNFPDTIWEVIYQKNQFSVTTTKINGVTMIDRPADEESKKAAKEILDYGSVLPPDVQVFYADGECNGNWVMTREVYEVCDGTVFAYIYPKRGHS